MTTTAKRSTALRLLPVLLALLLAFLAAPAAMSHPAAHSPLGASAATAHHDADDAAHDDADVAAHDDVDVAAHDAAEDHGSVSRTVAGSFSAQATAQPAPDASRALRSRLAVRVSASRAPPAAS